MLGRKILGGLASNFTQILKPKFVWRPILGSIRGRESVAPCYFRSRGYGAYSMNSILVYQFGRDDCRIWLESWSNSIILNCFLPLFSCRLLKSNDEAAVIAGLQAAHWFLAFGRWIGQLTPLLYPHHDVSDSGYCCGGGLVTIHTVGVGWGTGMVTVMYLEFAFTLWSLNTLLLQVSFLRVAFLYSLPLGGFIDRWSYNWVGETIVSRWVCENKFYWFIEALFRGNVLSRKSKYKGWPDLARPSEDSSVDVPADNSSRLMTNITEIMWGISQTGTCASYLMLC